MTQLYDSSNLVNSSLTLNTITPPHQHSLFYMIVCVVGLIFALGVLLLNGVVIKALALSRHTPDVSHVTVASLSLADLLTGLVLVYITLHNLIGFQHLTECLVRIGLIYTVTLSSYIHLLAITIDRYIKIIYPFYYFRIFTTSKVIKMSFSIWIFCGLIGFLPLLGWHQTVRKSAIKGDSECSFFGVIPNGFFNLNFTINVCVLMLTGLLYGRIIYVARKQHNAIATRQIGSMVIDKHAWKLAKTVFLVVVMSNLLWLPGVVLISLHMSGSLDHISMETKGELLAYSGVFAFINCLTNPIIYAAKIKAVRNLFRKLFCCRKPDQRSSSLTQDEQYEMER